MKTIYTLSFLCLLACNSNVEKKKTTQVPNLKEQMVDSVDIVNNVESDDPSIGKSYSNDRFRNVTVEKTDAHTYTIKGEAQIFESTFNWIIEDGHNEFQKGFEMTDAGAPEWGAFNFTVTAEKQRPNSTLMLFMFETSAKDGSRQHELGIALE